MKMSVHVLFCTQEEKRGFTVTEPETIYGMRCAPEAKKKQEATARAKDLQIYKSHLWLAITLRRLRNF